LLAVITWEGTVDKEIVCGCCRNTWTIWFYRTVTAATWAAYSQSCAFSLSSMQVCCKCQPWNRQRHLRCGKK